MGGSVFDQSARAYEGGLSLFRDAQRNDPLVNSAAGGFFNNTPYTRQAADMYRNTGSMGIVPQTMNQYLNPYQNQVINSTVGRMQDDLSQNLNNVRAQAAQSRAYGGARQGLVEAELMDRSQRNIGETVGALSQQGFNTAAQFGQSRIGQMQNAAAGLGGLGGQELNRFAMMGQLGLSRQQQDLATGQALMGGATTGFNLGQASNQMQQQAGMQQQQLMQQILGQAAGQYDQYANYPQTALATALAGLSGNPLQGATTSRTTQNPGLLPYMSLGAGLGSAYLGNPMAMGGK